MKMNQKEKSIINAGWTGNFVVCDTESTGFSANDIWGKLIQVSAVKVPLLTEEGDVIDLPDFDDTLDNASSSKEFNYFVDTEQYMKPCKKHPESRRQKLPKKIKELTGITDEQVWTAPTYRVVLKNFADFIGENTVMVYHNAPHDVSLLHHFGIKRGLSYRKYPTIDTCPLAKYLWPEFQEEYDEVNKDLDDEQKAPGPYKLETLAGRFGILDEHHHNGFNDCVVTVKLLRIELLELKKRGELKIVTDYSTLPIYAVDDDSDVDIMKPNIWQTPDGTMKRLYLNLVRTKKEGKEYAHIFYDFVRDEWCQKDNKKEADFKVREFDSVHARIANVLGVEDWTFENVKKAVEKVNYSLYHGYNNAYGEGKAKAELKKEAKGEKSSDDDFSADDLPCDLEDLF